MNLDHFFQEKDLSEEVYEVEVKGRLHLIPTTVVVNAITSTRGNERRELKKLLVLIDFRGGDLHHFLKHLAHGIAANYRGAL